MIVSSAPHSHRVTISVVSEHPACADVAPVVAPDASPVAPTTSKVTAIAALAPRVGRVVALMIDPVQWPSTH